MGYYQPLISNSIVIKDTFQVPGMKTPMLVAMGIHIGLFVWNPMFLSRGSIREAPPIMRVEYRETMPEIPKPKPPEIVKKVEKKPVPIVKKARKAGITLAKQPPVPVRAVKHAPKVAAPPPAPRSRPSVVKMPKFVPRVADEDALMSAQPTRVALATGLRPASNPMQAPVLKSKSRGIRATDVKFELVDRGGISSSAAGQVVNIPIGQERGETASIGSAAPLHEAPRGKRHLSATYSAPAGEGIGELAGKNRTGYAGRIQVGEPSEEEVIAAAGSARGTTVGHGVEIGGPVGDRKILRRNLPEYPAWAEEKGISALVKIYFTVKPDGSIRQSLRIVRSSGYSELDSLAKEALLAWKFSPTEARSTAEEAWGVVTFRFTLA